MTKDDVIRYHWGVHVVLRDSCLEGASAPTQYSFKANLISGSWELRPELVSSVGDGEAGPRPQLRGCGEAESLAGPVLNSRPHFYVLALEWRPIALSVQLGLLQSGRRHSFCQLLSNTRRPLLELDEYSYVRGVEVRHHPCIRPYN